MKINDSKGHKVGLRELIDGLRDNFVVLLDLNLEDKVTIETLLAKFDRAVSETILDLLDHPAPPSYRQSDRQRKTRSDKGLPRIVRSSETKIDPPVARPPRSRRGKRSGLPSAGDLDLAAQEEASKQASIDDVKGVAGVDINEGA